MNDGVMNDKIQKLIIKVICYLCVVLLLSMLFFSLNGCIQLPVLVLIISGTVICAILLKDRVKYRLYKATQALDSNQTVFGVIVLLMVLCRVSPIIFNIPYLCQDNRSDTGIHYFGAQQLVEVGTLESRNARYEMFFPYLYPYTVFLSFFYRLFNDIDIAIVFSNTLLDLIGGLLLYRIIGLLSKDKSAQRIGFLIWICNPFSIIMCWLPMNILLVNVLVLLSLYLGIMVLHNRGLLWSVAFGMVVFCANLFRPIFTVFLIAIIISLFLYNSVELKKKIVCTLLIIIFAFTPYEFVRTEVANTFNDDLLGSSGGWSFFVGSNYMTSGKWSREDSNFFFGEVVPKFDKISDAQNEIRYLGMNRYDDMGLRIIDHIGNKMQILFSQHSTSIYDIRYVFGLSSDSIIYKALGSLCGISFTSLILLTFIYIYIYMARYDTFYVCISIIGVTCGFLIVEVMNRYAAVYYPLLLPLASVQLSIIVKHHKAAVDTDCKVDTTSYTTATEIED